MTTRADRVEEERTDEQQAEIDKAWAEGKAQGFTLGMRAAADWLMELAKNHFETGNDERAKQMREIGRVLRDRAQTGK